jgi:hypothetical protein
MVHADFCHIPVNSVLLLPASECDYSGNCSFVEPTIDGPVLLASKDIARCAMSIHVFS